ncbi:BHLH domain-containing protein [Caerostris darwini]|uniref:BHLH domain-containing protein n=1 Tax=Caerostris darwini TaxID=1538125 RepID=A0AAV4X5U4_9ARAC|nr:BHLH domain-containing protein [Caerostris darwini]
MDSETTYHFEKDDINVIGVKESDGECSSFIENHEESICKTLNYENEFQSINHEHFNQTTIHELETKPKQCEEDANIIINSTITLNPIVSQDHKSEYNEHTYKDHATLKTITTSSAGEYKQEPYRGSARLVRLQAATNQSTENRTSSGCDISLTNSSSITVSSEDLSSQLYTSEISNVTENQHIICSEGEYQFLSPKITSESSQMSETAFTSMLQQDNSSSNDTSNVMYERIVFNDSSTSLADLTVPRSDKLTPCTSTEAKSPMWIVNSGNSRASNDTSVYVSDNSNLQYHDDSQDTTSDYQSSTNLDDVPDTQEMQRFITADNQVVYGYKDSNGEFHFFCPAMNERESHNEKERKRR